MSDSEQVSVVPLTPFPAAEYSGRVERARVLMDHERLDALLITSEANFRYFTGFDSPTWVSPTRPLYLVLPRGGEPHAIIPDGSVYAFRATTDIRHVDHWPAPVPLDDGISLLADALRNVARRHGRIGAELGFEQHLRMPVQDFLRVSQLVAPSAIVDGTAVIRTCRMVKSVGEVARIERAARLTSAAMRDLASQLHVGMTEHEACRIFQIDMLWRGADRSGYLVSAAGQDGYEAINLRPSERTLRAGDIFVIDTGAVVDGYFADIDRNFCVQRQPRDEIRRLNDQLFAATTAGLEACVPDARCCDIWRAMINVLGESSVDAAGIGRMGHSVGLQLTEQPSIHPDDMTRLVPGMVLTLEPSVAYVGSDGHQKLLVHEENLVVTSEGARLLSERGNQGFMQIG